MSGITNFYIEHLMKKFQTNFKGVFSSDNIPYFKINDVSFICNLSKTHEKGTHFVAVYISEKQIIYFDPLGIECYVSSIFEYLQLYQKDLLQSLVTIQHPFSYHCGYFCIGFIFALNNKQSLLWYQNLFFKKKLYKNDKIICNYIIKMMK